MNGSDFGTVSAVMNVLVVLFILSYIYDRIIERMGPRGEGWAWMQVVIGVFYTLLAIGILDLLLPWNAFFIGFLTFAVSGTPMSYGAYMRHREAHERAQKAMKE